MGHSKNRLQTRFGLWAIDWWYLIVIKDAENTDVCGLVHGGYHMNMTRVHDFSMESDNREVDLICH